MNHAFVFILTILLVGNQPFSSELKGQARYPGSDILAMRTGNVDHDNFSIPEKKDGKSSYETDSFEGQESDQEYEERVDAWHANRIERLKDARGWLRLAGLYWLEEGEQSFGSGQWARVRFPVGSIPEIAGIFEKKADTVFMRVAGAIDIRDERNWRLRDDIIYTPEVRRELRYRTLTWFVVQRDDMIGIRLYDDNSPHLIHFDGIDRYEVDRNWVIHAEFEPHREGSTMEIENVLGQFVPWPVAGNLRFEVDGHRVEMVALGTGERLFIPFADATSGSETYPGGRFVYMDRPAPGETAIIDFNVSYNPPCAINPHTTCPLPPRQNRLLFAVRAGEKHYEMYKENNGDI